MRSLIVHSAAIAAISLFTSAALHAQAGSVVGSFATPTGIVPSGLGPDASGNLILTGTGAARTIAFLTATGSLTGQFTPSNSNTPTGVTTDGIFLYVSDTSPLSGPNIDVYSMAGVYQRSFTTPASVPNGIVFTPQSGHLFINDFTANVVWEYDTAGTQIGSFPVLGTLQMGLAHDPVTNQFWGYERGGDLIHQYDASFTELSNFPGPVAHGYSTGNGIAFINGALFLVAIASRQIVVFDTTGRLAGTHNYGSGCPLEPIVYELFPAGTIDLSNQSFLYSHNLTGGLTVTQCTSNCFDTNYGTNLALGDDQLATNKQLGFSFPIPGSPFGSSTSIDVSSNGFVYLVSGLTSNHGCCDANVSAFLSLAPRISALWMDLDPGVAPGAVYFNAVPGKAIITWLNVFEINTRSANTCQIQLFPNGNFIIAYQTVANLNHITLSGYSSGNNAFDPGSRDLTATIPFSTGYGGVRLSLTTNRPAIGTTLNFQIHDAPANALLGAILLGSAQTSTPLDPLGMYGCTLLTSADLASATVALPAGTFSLPIPNNPVLAGGILYSQGAIAAFGINPFGVALTNGVELDLGF